jgi:hypothetical protein
MADVRPTPTQEENDLATEAGAPVKHDHDGAPLDVGVIPPDTYSKSEGPEIEPPDSPPQRETRPSPAPEPRTRRAPSPAPAPKGETEE